MLDCFAKRLNVLLKMTVNGRQERDGEVAKSVFQSIELIITSVQRISFGMLKYGNELEVNRSVVIHF